MKRTLLANSNCRLFLVLFCLFLFFSDIKANDIGNINSQIVVSGIVRDEAGVLLSGVSVTVKGRTDIGITTDSKGEYRLEVPDNATLEFSYTGFVTQEINVESRTIINIDLKTDTRNLEEVLVVGYGRQKRKDITGSIASVPKERLDMVPNLNIAQALQGAISGIGIQITQGGAAPRQSIMIRGRNSILASNEPLIVVDGVPYSGELMDINPHDVLSIEVLKDASAAAIYGSRGANGVILITTKIGSTDKPKIILDTRFSTQEAINLPVFLDGSEFYAFKELREPGRITATEQEVFDNKQWINWADLALRKGSSQQHNLSISGGFKNTNYFIGGSFLDVKGVAVNDGYRRVSSRINLESDITKWLKIGTRNQFSYDDRIGAPLDWNLVFRKNPLIKPYDADGNISLFPWPEFIDIRNPLEPLKYDYSNESYQFILNNYALVRFPFIDGLTYQLNTGIRRRFGNASNYIGRNTAPGLGEGGIANTNRSEEKNNVIENVFSYTKNIGKHNIFATVAYMYEENEGSANIVDARGFPHDFITYYSAAQANLVTPDYTFMRTVLNSQMIRVNYAYGSRYLLTLTGRRDGYSGFGATNKWGIFPSVAVGWNVADEKFFPWKDQFNKLKLRLSYGLNGNQAVGAYESISRYTQSNIVALGNTLSGYVPSRIGMDNLGWESSKTLNIGLDFGLLQNRIEGDINVFNTNTYDLLLNRTISMVNGLTFITQNIGKTKNTGVELSVTSRNIVGNNFTWTSSANLTHIKNKIVSLYGILESNGTEIDDVANSWFIGKPIRSNFNYLFDGVWQSKEAAEAAVWGSQPGFAKLRDVNNDGSITSEDRQIIGQLDPNFMWGLTNSVSFKNFNLSLFVHGVHGVTRLNELLQDASSGSDVRRNILKKNWWTPDNATNDFYMNALNAEKMAGISAPIYENASFVRVKDISLSYDFSRNFLDKSKLDKLRLYVVGRNLFTFTKWSGSDPELNHGRGINPLQREIVFGLTVNF